MDFASGLPEDIIIGLKSGRHDLEAKAQVSGGLQV